MDIEVGAFVVFFLVTLTFAAQAVKRRRDVLHGPYIESGFSKRLAAVTAL
jgi:hypothetical protein